MVQIKKGMKALMLCAFIALPGASVVQAGSAIPPSLITPDNLPSSLGTLKFKDGAPSNETSDKVYDYYDLMHGVEAYTNAYQGASVAALFKGFNEAGVPDNTAIVWSELMDSTSLFLTPNADTVYFWANVDLSKGPMVVETPPMALGVMDDSWFKWVTDFGLPGPDRGEGGKYLLVPSDYKGELPESGYFMKKVHATRVTMLGRLFLEDNSPKKPVALIKKTLKIYPFEAGGYGTSIASALQGESTLLRNSKHDLEWSFLRPKPPVKFTEGTGLVINTIPPSDYSYFELINEVVQREPVGSLDAEIMGSLAAIGIVKGQKFAPDARMKRILTDAAAIGSAAARTFNWNPRESEGFSYYPDSTWTNMLFKGGYNFETPPPAVNAEGVITPYPPTGARTLNSRSAMFFYATGITPAMIMRLTNIGSQYLASFKDSNNEYFDGAKTYKVTLPKGIPAAKFWSLTLYDNQTRSMLQTPQRFPRAGSQSYPGPAAVADADGTTTVYFSPKKPKGVKDGNWIQTDPTKGWNTLIRFYSPLESFFDKTWRPSEIELVK